MPLLGILVRDFRCTGIACLVASRIFLQEEAAITEKELLLILKDLLMNSYLVFLSLSFPAAHAAPSEHWQVDE